MKTHASAEESTEQPIEQPIVEDESQSDHVDECEDECLTETAINSSLFKKSYRLHGVHTQDLMVALQKYKEGNKI